MTDAHAGALVEGTVIASYAYREFKGNDDNGGLDALILSAHHDVSAPAAHAATVAQAVNAARDLQNRPANVLTPTALAERAQALQGVTVEVLDRRRPRGRRDGRVRGRRARLATKNRD